jgi:hypothetical protein
MLLGIEWTDGVDKESSALTRSNSISNVRPTVRLPRGGLAILFGNPAHDGAVVKG